MESKTITGTENNHKGKMHPEYLEPPPFSGIPTAVLNESTAVPTQVSITPSCTYVLRITGIQRRIPAGGDNVPSSKERPLLLLNQVPYAAVGSYVLKKRGYYNNTVEGMRTLHPLKNATYIPTMKTQRREHEKTPGREMPPEMIKPQPFPGMPSFPRD